MYCIFNTFTDLTYQLTVNCLQYKIIREQIFKKIPQSAIKFHESSLIFFSATKEISENSRFFLFLSWVANTIYIKIAIQSNNELE